MKTILKYIFVILFFYLFLLNNSNSTLQEKLINNLEQTNTLSFDFIQKIEEKEEIGNCYIKYPLLMKCNYKDLKGKIVIEKKVKFL